MLNDQWRRQVFPGGGRPGYLTAIKRPQHEVRRLQVPDGSVVKNFKSIQSNRDLITFSKLQLHFLVRKKHVSENFRKIEYILQNYFSKNYFKNFKF